MFDPSLQLEEKPGKDLPKLYEEKSKFTHYAKDSLASAVTGCELPTGKLSTGEIMRRYVTCTSMMAISPRSIMTVKLEDLIQMNK